MHNEMWTDIINIQEYLLLQTDRNADRNAER